MTLTVTHSKVSVLPDGNDPNIGKPSDWNAGHVIAGASDLTKVDDTNVTLTLGGTPVGSLFNGVSLTLGWTGTLAANRLNSNVVQSVVNDSNITGSISGQALTLGWTGTLANARLAYSSVTISGHPLSLGRSLNLAQADIASLTT